VIDLFQGSRKCSNLTYFQFRDLYNWEEARPKAIEAYEKAKSNWMYVTAYTVGKDLHIDQ
jgi:hypothetical protein